MPSLRSICFFLLLLISHYGWSQSSGIWSNRKEKRIAVADPSVQLDSLSLVPFSVIIPSVDSLSYSIDWINARLTWVKKPETDSVTIFYRVLPARLNATRQHMNFDSILPRFAFRPPSGKSGSTAAQGLDFGNLTYNGSFGRSLAFGNRQDVVLNSSLNLQLSGYLGDSIYLSAALSDNNIPIQPDGNTQNLNEFDQVFVQFSKKNWRFSMGDIDIRQQNSYFLNFYKRLQGALFETETNLNKQASNKLQLSAAAAKGKFTRNIFNGLEGNQGPYRLKGANNELFFIVLANSERVWIDGELMQRGEDQDYVINYNTAEITFTPRQMISKDKRIQIEFEYADRNFLNAQLYLNNTFKLNEKWSFTVGAFSNSDARNSPISQTLDPAQRQFLSKIGDSIRNAYYPSAIADTFASGKILYRKVDTLLNGRPDSFYVYSTDRTQLLYQLNFIQVGQGRGNYMLDIDAPTNGKLFRWSPPDPSGNKTGDYEPAILLVAPRKQQLLTVGSHYRDSTFELQSELAISTLDLNTFSSADEANDQGTAARLTARYYLPLKGSESRLTFDMHAERIAKSFRPIERLRSVEFNRDWGLPLETGTDGETLLTGGISFQSSANHSIRYTLGSYQRDSGYQAFRHAITQDANLKGWRLQNQLSYSSLESAIRNGFFLRPVIDLSKRLKGLLNDYQLGFYYTLEKNQQRLKAFDSLDASSFSFDIWKVYLRSPETTNKWGISLYTRGDKLPSGSTLKAVDRSINLNGYAELMSNEHHQLRLNTTFRQLTVQQKLLSSGRPEATILGRTEYLLNAWKNAITGQVLYELGSGQEPRRAFAFLEVPAGQGEYTWIDYNNDGLQQISEFEIARFRDQAKFIRIFSPTTEFIKASYLQFNYSFIINPKNALGASPKTAWKNLISKLYLQSALQSARKNISDGLAQFNPFQPVFGDTSLITMDQQFSNTISFNRLNTNWGIDLNNLRSSGKAFLSYGFESRQLNDWNLKTRITFKKKFTTEIQSRLFSNILETPGLANRNFHIKGFSVEPRLIFTYQTTFRLKAGWKWDERTNTAGEKASIRSLLTDIKYNVLTNTSLNTNLAITSIRFNAPANTALAYSMLEGLLPGQNFLWTIDLTRRLTRFLEVSIQYEGRKAGTSGVVHTGRGQVRALF